MKKTLNLIKYFIIFFTNIIVFLVSLGVPKTRKVVIIGGWFGKRFADNSRYLYSFINSNKENINVKKVVWVTKNIDLLNELIVNGVYACKSSSLKSYWYHLRAKIHIVDQGSDDISPYFSIRAIKINLWHGFPLKKIGAYRYSENYKQSIGTFPHKFKLFVKPLFTKGFWGNSYILATSNFAAKVLSYSFEKKESKMIICPYPRNFYLGNAYENLFLLNSEKLFIYKLKQSISIGKKIIGYFPTFRDIGEEGLFGSRNNEELTLLFETLKKNNYIVLVKNHLHSSNFDKLNPKDVVWELQNITDLYPLLNFVDILITDYSSIYFDFLYTQKPIIFFPYDIDYYSITDRGFIFDYDEYTPGPKIYELSILQEYLDKGYSYIVDEYMNNYLEKASQIKKEIFANNSYTVLDVVKNILNVGGYK